MIASLMMSLNNNYVFRHTVIKKNSSHPYSTSPLINSHTHIGDAFITLKKLYGIQELVGPSGIKHTLLKQTKPNIIIEGMKKALKIMKNVGTTHFCDFREGGLKGVQLLKKALPSNIIPIILSRPQNQYYHRNEITSLLRESQGIGISSISDWNYYELVKIARHTQKKGKLFALHASERIHEPIDLILDLKPTFLVHMIQATPNDLAIVADHNIPVVICPRSNAYFNLRPNVLAMKKAGIPIMLGTDNAMITSPDIIQEAQYLIQHFKVTPQEVRDMISKNPRKYLNVT
jgi:cytosine/adenosine deaminase-related metal-dependent hydrolase